MFGTGRKNRENDTWRDGVFLIDAKDTFEADIFVSKLAAEKIPAEKRYRGASNFIEISMGLSTISPVGIYVPAEALERAKKIIEPVPIEDDFEEACEDEAEEFSESGPEAEVKSDEND